MTSDNPTKHLLEAALLASPLPLSIPQLAALFEPEQAPGQDEIAAALAELAADCSGRGVELVEVASGFRYQVRSDTHALLSRLWAERPARYSRALLETLALIAYRQPITRAEIEQVRGVAVSSNIVRTLEEREWVRVVGHRDLPGRPELLGTTRQFLDYFKLRSLDELPPLGEIRDLAEVDAELALGGMTVPPDAGADAPPPEEGAHAASTPAEPGADAGHAPVPAPTATTPLSPDAAEASPLPQDSPESPA